MSENAKVVALLLLLLLAMGVVGEMDYQDALRAEQPRFSADLCRQRSAVEAIPPTPEPIATDDAAGNDCMTAKSAKRNDDPPACQVPPQGR
jgi:hypothetical protein